MNLCAKLIIDNHLDKVLIYVLSENIPEHSCGDSCNNPFKIVKFIISLNSIIHTKLFIYNLTATHFIKKLSSGVT